MNAWFEAHEGQDVEIKINACGSWHPVTVVKAEGDRVNLLVGDMETSFVYAGIASFRKCQGYS